MNNKRKAYVLYRSKRYGKWQPAKIVIPDDVTDVKKYVIGDLKEVGIDPAEVTIEWGE